VGTNLKDLVIFKILKTDKLIITKKVFDELRESDFFDKFLEFLSDGNVEVKDSDRICASGDFGDGELSSIFLAEKTGDSLLMDDRPAGRLAEERGIIVMDIPTFLSLCKERGVSREELKQIIDDLKEKDYYGFSKETREKLLE